MAALCGSFTEELLLAVLDDIAAGDNANEGILVIHNGNKVLIGCPFHLL